MKNLRILLGLINVVIAPLCCMDSDDDLDLVSAFPSEVLQKLERDRQPSQQAVTSQILTTRYPGGNCVSGGDYVLPEGCISSGVENKGLSEVIYVHDQNGRTVTETFFRYYRDLQATAAADDIVVNRYANQAVFAQFCVQASKTQNVDKKAFQELLTKIKAGIINADTDTVRMTAKDMNHRLLSYIPYGHLYALVNDRKVRLTFEQYFQKPGPIATAANFDHSLFPKFGEGHSSAGGPAFKWTDEEELTVDYKFESQPEHHAAVTTAFLKLLSSGVSV